jgi:mannose-6-phosphate isomerase-like protein (cupin superfamily)
MYAPRVEARITDPLETSHENPLGESESLRTTWVHHGDHSSAAITSIGPGGIGPHIHHEHDEVVVVIEGEADFRLGEDVKTVTLGDLVTVPAGTVHAPINSSAGCVLISVFAPRFDPDNPDRHFVDG